MPFRLAIFDFDGTLADSFTFFVHAQRVLADRHGFAPIDAAGIEAARRRSVSDLVRHSGLPPWKLPRVANDFRSMMRGAEGIELFEGVEVVLASLAARGVMLGLLTSNARENIERVLGAANLAHFADVDCGMSLFGKRPRIRSMLRRLGVPAADAIYIGDQDSDGDAANAAGVAFGAVGWGYAAIEALRPCGPRHEFRQVDDIAALWGA